MFHPLTTSVLLNQAFPLNEFDTPALIYMGYLFRRGLRWMGKSDRNMEIVVSDTLVALVLALSLEQVEQ